MPSLNYRPEIDGLRALAVLLVVLYHAGLAFPGGFIGVDMFFVISGFLITGVILRQHEECRFSLGDFWNRRIRRIFPAAAFLVGCTLFFGFFLLLPADFKSLAESTIYQQLLASNVYFWLEIGGGYFDKDADLFPLLHTWSLSVEEQFYLLYPFVLLAILKFRRSVQLLSLSTFLLISFAVSIWGVTNKPSATFFLLPTRAWELLIGGLLWYLPSVKNVPSAVKNLMCTLSLAGVLAPSILYSQATPFPGMSALAPCLSTAILIYFATPTSKIIRFLSTKGFVFIGLISYSFYLWHWPVFVFARIWMGVNMTPTVKVSLVCISFLFAIFSWYFVEKPFRKRSCNPSTQKVVLWATTSVVLLVMSAWLINLYDGLHLRLPSNAIVAGQDLSWRTKFNSASKNISEGRVPFVGAMPSKDASVDFLVWGDSHAMALGSTFDSLGKQKGLCGVVLARNGTIPLLGMHRPMMQGRFGADMIEWNEQVFNFIKLHSIPRVVLIGRWAHNVEGRENGDPETIIALTDNATANAKSGRRDFQAGLLKTLTKLKEIGCKVMVVKQVPLQEVAPEYIIANSWIFGHEPVGVSIENHLRRQKNTNLAIEQCAAAFEYVVILDPQKTMFNDAGMSKVGKLGIGKTNATSFYFDTNHISKHGGLEFIQPLLLEKSDFWK